MESHSCILICGLQQNLREKEIFTAELKDKILVLLEKPKAS